MSPCFLRRGVDPVVRRQHVHESGDPDCHAHRGRGRLPSFHVPAGVRPANGRHVPRVGGHAEARAGQRKSQTDGQPRYRINRPCWLPSPRVQEEALLFLCFLFVDFLYGFFTFFLFFLSDLTHTKPVFVVCPCSCMYCF